MSKTRAVLVIALAGVLAAWLLIDLWPQDPVPTAAPATSSTPSATSATTAATTGTTTPTSTPTSTPTMAPTTVVSTAPRRDDPVPLSVLLTTGDLTSAGFDAVPGQGSRGAGDMQYALTPCLQKSPASTTGGPAASADWYAEAGAVAQTVARAAGNAAARVAAGRIARWHQSCAGATQTSVVQNAAGYSWRFRLDERSGGQDVSVVQRGDLVMVLAITPTATTRTDVIVQAATRRLG